MTRYTRVFIAFGLSLGISACDGPFDFDLRGVTGAFSTAPAAAAASAERPRPDARGVISYPGYQVAVARAGDTIEDVAVRVGLPEAELAQFNGITADVPLRGGEIIALPRRVAEPSTATGAAPGQIDVTELAGRAIDNAPATRPVAGQPAQSVTGPAEEPIRHRVERGETAFTIARLYRVSTRALAEWNGLGPDFAVREGQYLLIPLPRTAAPAPQESDPAPTTAPGVGSPTPTPPSATLPLPPPEAPAATPEPEPEPETPVADVGPTSAPPTAEMQIPVQGSIIRPYSKGRNDGIDIQAAAGAPVVAAASGTVAAITNSADGRPIVVIRHPQGLLTVYANVTDVGVAKGDPVRRGQKIANLRDDDTYVHFEVRDGFDSVDPERYLGG